MASNKQRFVELDFIRGIAMIIVIIIHTVIFVTLSKQGNLIVEQNSIPHILDIGIPLFFIVSGTVLALNYVPPFPYIRFILKRGTRILIPYLIISSIFILFLITIIHRPVVPMNIPIWLLTGTTTSPYWYIVVIMQLYLLYPVIVKFMKKADERKKKSVICALFAVQVLYLYGWWAYSDLLTSSTILASIYKRIIFDGLFFFVIGVFIGLNFDKWAQRTERVRFSIICLVFMALAVLDFLWNVNFMKVGEQDAVSIMSGLIGESIVVIMCIIAFIFFFKLSHLMMIRKGHLFRGIASVGEYSFGIYLVFMMFVIYFSEMVFDKNTIVSDVLIFPAFFLSVLICSFVTVFLVSLVPRSEYIIGDNPMSRRKKKGADEPFWHKNKDR